MKRLGLSRLGALQPALPVVRYERQAALPPFIEAYNGLRPRSALNHLPPMSRIPAMNHLLKISS